MIVMKRISFPAWAPSHAQHVMKTTGERGDAAKAVISPLLPQIYDELDRLVNEFANDPDQCFESPDDFPVQAKLDGQYYLGSETYEGNAEDDFFRLWLEVRCLEKPWHPSQERDGCDYLGLEAIVTVDGDGEGFEFDDGFNTSSV